MFKQLVGRKCIVRTYSAGVFFGIVAEVSEDGQKVRVENARRMWHWSGAASLSQAAVEGVKSPDDCKFPTAVPEVFLTNAIEYLPLTETAIINLENVPVWQQ